MRQRLLNTTITYCLTIFLQIGSKVNHTKYRKILNYISWLFNFMIIFCFARICWYSSNEANFFFEDGYSNFLFGIPVFLFFATGSFIVSKYSEKKMISSHYSRYLLKILIISLTIFYLSPFIPGLHKITEIPVKLTIKASKIISGKTPFEWSQ